MSRPSAVRELLEQLGLAAVGAVSLTAERADRLADDLASRGGLRREEVRTMIDEATARWRGDTGHLGELAGVALDKLFADLGLVVRDDLEELELRLAQLEHRLRLLEPPLSGADGAPPAA
ncbi:MAG: phasin family protein [Gaiellaceae bacterium]